MCNSDPEMHSDDQSKQAVSRAVSKDARTRYRKEDMLTLYDAFIILGMGPNDIENRLVASSYLLRLPFDDTDNNGLYPKFQFEHTYGRVYRTVPEVNKLLRAAEDPWGAASWWFTENRRTGARPADLVGTDHDHDLLEIAKATAAAS